MVLWRNILRNVRWRKRKIGYRMGRQYTSRRSKERKRNKINRMIWRRLISGIILRSLNNWKRSSRRWLILCSNWKERSSCECFGSYNFILSIYFLFMNVSLSHVIVLINTLYNNLFLLFDLKFKHNSDKL